MTPIRLLAPAIIAFAIASCASNSADQYDTANPYGAADASQVNAPANPVYDTPAAYEESAATATNATATATNADTYVPSTTPNVTPVPTAPAASSNGAAIIHTVVAGDTLSGISAKYKVPSAAIKQANNMTKDTVILGRKMVIPPAQ